MANRFLIREALHFGWSTVKQNIGDFLPLMLVLAGLSGISWSIDRMFNENPTLLVTLFKFIASVGEIIIDMGLLKIALKFVDGQRPVYTDLFPLSSLFFDFLFASILYGLIILGGSILLIIPAIIWSIKYQFYGYFVVDKAFSPLQALKESGLITRGEKLHLFLFGLLLIGVNLVGVSVLGIGLMVTLPVTLLAHAYVYRQLVKPLQPQGV